VKIKTRRKQKQIAAHDGARWTTAVATAAFIGDLID